MSSRMSLATPKRNVLGYGLRGLPKLEPTDVIDITKVDPKIANRLHLLSPSADRWKIRSRTFQGIADAMAAQWG